MVFMIDYVEVQHMSNMRLEMPMAADGRNIGGHVRRVDGFYDRLCRGATHELYIFLFCLVDIFCLRFFINMTYICTQKYFIYKYE